MSDRDEADLFAIPDFWRVPSFQPPPLAAKDRSDGYFNLEVAGHGPVTFFLGKDDPFDNTEEDVFFRIPSLLGQHQDGAQPGGNGEEEARDQTSTAKDFQQLDDTAGISAQDEDYWLLPEGDSIRARPEYKTWAAFEHADIPNSIPLLATEQGPELVDALVSADANPLGLDDHDRESGSVLNPAGYCTCLLELALGRCSVLFDWDDSKKCFHSTLPACRISGYTGPILRSVEKNCLECGNNSRFLRVFVDHTFSTTSAHTMPSRVALSRGVDRLLLIIQQELGVRGQNARSLLQLQALISPSAFLLSYIRELVTKLSRPGLSDEGILTALFQEAQATEHSAVFMRDVIKQILQIVSEPWLAFSSKWIGLDPGSKSTLWTGKFGSKSFVRLGDRIWIDDMGMELAESDYFLDRDKMPAFIPEDMAKDLFETGRNLRFLWTNHPDHPLSNMKIFAEAHPPPLRWQFDWTSISTAEQQSLSYEKALSLAINNGVQKAKLALQDPSSLQEPLSLPLRGDLQIGWHMPSTELRLFGKSEDQIEERLLASIAKLNGPISGTHKDDLATSLRRQLFDSNEKGDSNIANHTLALNEFAPHWSLLPLLSFGPVIAAQARVVSRECMRLLFSAHEIRRHLRLQCDFQLLGNGMFCSRLTHSLFDSDLAGAEMNHGVELSSGGLGLRLSDRDSWPPASSELRLALMGVLTESYFQRDDNSGSGSGSGRRGEHELPGGMSFAVRDLTEEEMDRCMDPDSVEALDFLRLSYKPPLALMPVITPVILNKYDRVFRLLLRVLRVYYVVNLLSRGGGRPGRKGEHEDDVVVTRFCIEARHFVANMMAYFLDIGVGMPWQRFDAWLDRVQAGLGERETVASTTMATEPNIHAAVGAEALAATTTPDRLRDRHEQTLDEIMLALFLRKRQQPLFQLLQDIFGVVLDFAKATRDHAKGQERTERQDKPKGGSGDKNTDTAMDDAESGPEEDDVTTRKHEDRSDRQDGQNGSQEDQRYKEHQDHVRRLYASFRKKVGVFVTVCRSLGDKEADSQARKNQSQHEQSTDDGDRDEEGSLIPRLLLMLDYNGSYTSTRSTRVYS